MTVDYQAIIDQLEINLINCIANPKPSYSVEGVRYDWLQYQKWLNESIKYYEDKIAVSSGDGTFQIDTFINI